MDEVTPQVNNRNNSSKILIPVAVVIILLGIIAFVARGQQKPQDAKVAEKPASETTVSETAETPESKSQEEQSQGNEYKDGTYSATGNYVSPGGAEELGVQITLKDGVITNAEVDSKASRPNSVKFQGMFVSGFKPLVVGKNIDEVQLTKVSGSSLAPGGFNEALEEIKQQARS